jgi:predicted AlkP superfamily phosphohydrolase/phosphomutase
MTAEKRAEAVLHLMRQETWDLFMVVFMETDRLHHFMWQYMEEDHPTYGAKFLECYRLMDRLAGQILAQLEADDQVIFLSDHGFTTLIREVYLNVWLEQRGYLEFLEGSGRGLAAVSPSTRAFSLDPGRIYVNLAGREPRGTVSSGELPCVVNELIQDLESLKDPSSGAPIVRHIYRADDIYQGPFRDRAPDLLVMPHDGYDIKGTFEPRSLMGRGKLVGMHKYDNATLFIRGHEMRVDHASVHDVLPTACRLMGIECPQDVNGQVVIAS